MLRHKAMFTMADFVLTRPDFSHRVAALDRNGSIPRGPNGYPSRLNFLPDPEVKSDQQKTIMVETVVEETVEPRKPGETTGEKTVKTSTKSTTVIKTKK